jgi:hypothetical protein
MSYTNLPASFAVRTSERLYAPLMLEPGLVRLLQLSTARRQLCFSGKIPNSFDAFRALSRATDSDSVDSLIFLFVCALNLSTLLGAAGCKTGRDWESGGRRALVSIHPACPRSGVGSAAAGERPSSCARPSAQVQDVLPALAWRSCPTPEPQADDAHSCRSPARLEVAHRARCPCSRRPSTSRTEGLRRHAHRRAREAGVVAWPCSAGGDVGLWSRRPERARDSQLTEIPAGDYAGQGPVSVVEMLQCGNVKKNVLGLKLG